MDSLAPAELVRLCQRALPDDPRPFERLVALYKGRVFATAFRLMGDPQEAEDQAQEVFLKIYRGIMTLEDPATVTTWIYRITTTTCLDMLDKQRRRPATQSLTSPGDEWNEEPRYPDRRTPTPEEAALRRELRQCLEAALAGLDGAARAMLVLRDIEGRSYQEIAETLALGMSAVKMRIHRARLAFHRIFDRVCPGLEPSGRGNQQSAATPA
jgi:RNA polymerase sigma-70 factor (ECF subfamily)